MATALAQAAATERSARETLARALGLWGDQLKFKLPKRLPGLPEAPRIIDNAEQQALAQ